MSDVIPAPRDDKRAPGVRTPTDTELLSTLFELGREVTSVLDLEELLARVHALLRRVLRRHRLCGGRPLLGRPVRAERVRPHTRERGHGLPEREIRMRTNQLWHWIYFRGARDFAEMLNISKTLRATLAASGGTAMCWLSGSCSRRSSSRPCSTADRRGPH